MSNNVGKKLQEQNNAKFENDQPENVSPFSEGVSGEILSGFGNQFKTDVASEQAGRAFGNEGISESPFDNDYFNSKLLGFDLGSVTDGQETENKGYMSVNNRNIDFEAFKADQQNAFAKVGALGAQFVGKTVVGTAGNLIGGIYGIGEWALSDEGSVNSIFDNKFYRHTDDLTKQIELKNSVFVNHKDGFGLNFNTLKGTSDAFSFITSMVASELIMNTVGNIAGGAGTGTLPLRLMRYGKQMGKFIKGFDKLTTLMEGGDDIKKMARQLGKSVDEMSRIKNNYDIAAAVVSGAGNFARRGLTVTGYEAGMEGRGAKDELIETLKGEMEYFLESADMTPEEKQAYREEKMKDIERQGNLAGMTTFALNIGMLNISNAMQFPQIFGNSFVKGSNIGKIVRDGIGQVSKEKGKWAATKSIMGSTGRILKNPATEFMEETLQGVASEASKNYFEIMMGTNSQAGVLAPRTRNISDSIYKAVSDTYGTEEGLHEGLIGAVVGAIGIPGAKRVSRKDSKDGKAGKKFQMQGGIWEGIRENRKRAEETQIAIDTINNSKMSDVLKYNRDNAIRASLDTESEDFHNITGSKVGFDTVRDNKVYRYTMDRLEKGMGETIKEDIDELKTLAQTNIEEYRKLFDKNETFTQEEAIKEVEAFEQKSKVYTDAYNKVNKRFHKELLRDSEDSKLLIDTLTYAVATEKIENGRIDKLTDVVSKKLEGKFTPEQIKSYIKNSALYKGMENEINTEIDQKTEAKRNRNLDKKEKAELANRLEAELDEDTRDFLSKHPTSKDVEKTIAKYEKDKKKYDPNTEEGKFNIEALDGFIEDARNAEAKRQELKATLEEDIKSKRDDYNPNLSSSVRNKRNALEKRNKELEENMSSSMKKISKARKADPQGLENYLAVDEALRAHSEAAPESILDSELDEWQSFDEMKREFQELSDKVTTAMEVGRYLFGFSNNPMQAYLAVKRGQFAEDIDNADRLMKLIDMMRRQGDSQEEIEEKLEELKDVNEYLKKNLEEAMLDYQLRTKADEEETQQFRDFVQSIDEFIAKLQAEFKKKEKKKEKSEKAVKTDNSKQENKDEKDDDEHEKEEQEKKGKGKKTKIEITDNNAPTADPEEVAGLRGLIGHNTGTNNKDDGDDSEDDSGKGSTKSPKGKGSSVTKRKRSQDSIKNTLTISEAAQFGQSEEFRKLIRDNRFKIGMPATLKMWEESQVNLETNTSGLEKYLISQKVDVEAYQRGYQKMIEMRDNNDFSELKKEDLSIDKDVRTFISWMPVQFDVFDEQHVPGEEHKYDPSGKTPLFSQKAFFKADDLEQNKKERSEKIKEYNRLYEKYENDLKEELESTDDKGEKSRFQAKFNRKVQEAQREVYNWGHNATTNFEFRRSLALSTFGQKGKGWVNLQIDHVNQGPLQRHTDTVGKVEEHSLAELVDINSLDVKDLAYGDRSNKWTQIDGTKIDSVDGSPFEHLENKNTALSGKVYLNYRTQTGANVPVQLNTKKLSQKHVDILIDHIEKFLRSNGEYTFKKSGIDIFDAVAKKKGWDKNPNTYMTLDNLMSFFMRRSKGATWNALFLKNAYLPVSKGADSYLQILTGETSDITIDSVKFLKENRKYIHEQLSKMRYTINKDFLLQYDKSKKPSLMKDVLKMYIDQGILNHSFTVSDNFDKVFSKVDNKKIFISKAGSTPQRSHLQKPKSEAELFRGLKEQFVSGKANSGKGEIKLYHVTNKIYDDVVRMYSKYKKAILEDEARQNMTVQREDLNSKESKLLFKEVVDRVINARIEAIMAVENAKPGYLKNSDHATNYVAQESDSDLDKMYRLMEATRAVLSNGIYKIGNKVSENSKYQGSNSALRELFNKSSKATPIGSYSSKENKQTNTPSSNITSKKAFLTMMHHIGFMEDYAGELKVKFRFDSPSLDPKTGKKYKKEGLIKGIRMDGYPIFDEKTSTISGGRVYVRIETKGKDGKKSTDEFVLMSETGQPLGNKQNIITHISLPFADGNLDMKDDILTELEEREEKRKEARSQGVTSLSKNVEKLVNKGNDAVSQIFSNPDDETAKFYRGNKSQFAATKPDDNSKKNSGKKKTDKSLKASTPQDNQPPKLSNIEEYTSDGYNSTFIVAFSQFIKFKDNKYNEKGASSLGEVVKNSLNITTSNELIDIYNYFKENGIFEKFFKDDANLKKLNDDQQFENFAELLLGEKVNIC